MKKIFTLFILFSFLGCQNNKKENRLIGDWKEIRSYSEERKLEKPPKIGISFIKDSMELYNGFSEHEWESNSNKYKLIYKGTWTNYELHNDSIFIMDPFTDKLQFQWKIEEASKDTLILKQKNSEYLKLKRYNPKKDTLKTYDQIILSRTGCYGKCPIIDISINRNGDIYFQGEGYVETLGWYKGVLNKNQVKQIFKKFENAEIFNLENEYSSGNTDGESITTSFVKNGKIIKTIDDYDNSAPSELYWAYVPLQNMYSSIQMDSIKNIIPPYPKMSYYTFKKDSLMLSLQKSESFFLWTELKNSKHNKISFDEKYEIRFRPNYTYYGPDPNKKNKKQKFQGFTDGRKFKFFNQEGDTTYYDLGYNFIDLNFNKEDFHPISKYDY